jgi:hypothetical protein
VYAVPAVFISTNDCMVTATAVSLWRFGGANDNLQLILKAGWDDNYE